MEAARRRSDRRQAAEPPSQADALRGILTLIQWQQQIIKDLLKQLDIRAKRPGA